MHVNIWMVGIGLAAFFGAAEPVFAWEPVTHAGLAASVLNHLALLPAAVAAILARHTVAYLYGNVAADVVFAKRLSRVKQFCHHWSTGFALLDSAQEDHGRAFAYGYLSHLAADTVAHGKFVPRQIVVCGCSVNFGHFYWELRAGALEEDATSRLLEDVLRCDHTADHRALADHIKGTFLAYDLNRRVFQGMSTIASHRTFRRGVAAWGHYSRWHLSPELVASYRSECIDRIHAILAEGSRSALVREDPNGTSALMHLRVRRREIRRRKRRGLCNRTRLHEASAALAPTPDYASTRFTADLRQMLPAASQGPADKKPTLQE